MVQNWSESCLMIMSDGPLADRYRKLRLTPTIYTHYNNLYICPTALAGGQASCGGTHTMVLTAEGRIFAWGRGSFGRLGTGLEKDCHSPVEVFLPGLSILMLQSLTS